MSEERNKASTNEEHTRELAENFRTAIVQGLMIETTTHLIEAKTRLSGTPFENKSYNLNNKLVHVDTYGAGTYGLAHMGRKHIKTQIYIYIHIYTYIYT
jgi:hypothetical protein